MRKKYGELVSSDEIKDLIGESEAAKDRTEAMMEEIRQLDKGQTLRFTFVEDVTESQVLSLRLNISLMVPGKQYDVFHRGKYLYIRRVS
jgi:phosphoserine phosphatase